MIDEKEIIKNIYFNTFKLVGSFMLFLFLICCGIFILIKGDRNHFIGIISIVVSIPFCLFSLYRSINRAPAVIIKMDGILHNCSIGGKIFIPWEDIEEIYMYIETYRLKRYRCIALKSKDKYGFSSNLNKLQLKFKFIFKSRILKISENFIDFDIQYLHNIITIAHQEKNKELLAP